MLETNEYFDGNVKSIAFNTDTLLATVGVINSGEHIFNTSDNEKITVISGTLTLERPDDSEYTNFKEGEYFSAPANYIFKVKVSSQISYLCLYS